MEDTTITTAQSDSEEEDEEEERVDLEDDVEPLFEEDEGDDEEGDEGDHDEGDEEDAGEEDDEEDVGEDDEEDVGEDDEDDLEDLEDESKLAAEDDAGETDFVDYADVLEDEGADEEEADQGLKRRGEHAFDAAFRPIRKLVPPKKRKAKNVVLDPNVMLPNIDGMLNPDDCLTLFEQQILPELMRPSQLKPRKRSENKRQVLLTLRALVAARGFQLVTKKRKGLFARPDIAKLFEMFGQRILVGVRPEDPTQGKILVFLAWSDKFNIKIARKIVDATTTSAVSQVVIVTRVKATSPARVAVEEICDGRIVTWFREIDLRRNVYQHHKLIPRHRTVPPHKVPKLLRFLRAKEEELKTLPDEDALCRFYGQAVGDIVECRPIAEHPVIEPTIEYRRIGPTTVQTIQK